jgi:predicted PurR-regulated permease PerM
MDEFRKKFFALSFIGLILGTTLLVLYMLLPFWKPVTLALISAAVFYPIQKLFQKLFRSPLIATFFTLGFIFLAVILPSVIALIIFGQEITKLFQYLNHYYQSGKFQTLAEELRSWLYINLYKFQEHYPFLKELLNEENLRELLNKLYSYLSSFFTQLTKSAFFGLGSALFGIFVYLLTLFFALYQGKQALTHAKNIIPLEEKDKEEIFSTIYNAVTAVIYGTAGTAIVQALVAFGVYLYYGLPYPFLWALLTALSAFIPPFGSGYVWFPLALYELFFVDTTKGLVGLAVGFLVISTIDNFVRPIIMKEKIELPYIVLFFAVMGGIFTFGFTGIFLGPTIFALFITLVKLYEQKFVKETSKGV